MQHEDVLDDLEGQVRRMRYYLGLPFEDACLDFHRTDRAVRTASSEQIRRPINRSGQDARKPFEPWRDELKDALKGIVRTLRSGLERGCRGRRAGQDLIRLLVFLGDGIGPVHPPHGKA